MVRRKKTTKTGSGETLAAQADRHVLYEQSVQDVEQEAEFLEEAYFEIRGRKPVLLREDFCGTASAASQWVINNRLHHAIGVDIDPGVLDSGRQRHLVSLSSSSRKRIDLIQGDVRTAKTSPVDIICGFNFSYWCFKKRKDLLDYFVSARRGLKKGGLFFVDVFGGSEAFTECKEKTKHNGFTYVWQQKSYDPVTGDYVCHIHFRFPDGSRIKKAFSYHWRLWTLPELLDVLADAGFSRSHVYWQGTDEDGEPNGEFSKVASGENDPAWIAYIVSEK
jgi:SAM-dependent methyltransferase